MNISKYTEGLGQKAKELPPEYKCFTEVEVEFVINRVLLDIRAKLTPEEFKKVELSKK